MSGVLLRPELAIIESSVASRLHDQVGRRADGNIVFVLILAVGVAWMTLMTTRRARLGGIIAILLVELVGVAWVCSLYQVLFQPLPSLAGTALGFLLPIGFLETLGFLQRRRERAPVLSVETVTVKPRARVKRGELAPEAVAQACEVTAVVCDIANKHDLAEECEPAAFAEITEKFLAHATEAFRKAGAYIESAGGEGVVAIFGYPGERQAACRKSDAQGDGADPGVFRFQKPANPTARPASGCTRVSAPGS